MYINVACNCTFGSKHFVKCFKLIAKFKQHFVAVKIFGCTLWKFGKVLNFADNNKNKEFTHIIIKPILYSS